MDSIIFGCSVTNKTTSGSYDYYLYSRVDNYAVILKAKTDGTEYLFRVILQSEDIATVWAGATGETYKRPDAMSEQVKKYVVTKFKAFQSINRRDVADWV